MPDTNTLTDPHTLQEYIVESSVEELNLEAQTITVSDEQQQAIDQAQAAALADSQD